jgi:hypothetical protein
MNHIAFPNRSFPQLSWPFRAWPGWVAIGVWVRNRMNWVIPLIEEGYLRGWR